MTTTNETSLAPRRPVEMQSAAESEWSVQRIVEQTKKIQECMTAVMKVDEHYGVIPGTQGRDGKPPKPTLLKAGAEKLCLMFRFDPEYEVVTSSETPALFSYTIRCILWHIPTGARIASGLGSCNSREKKYVRAAPRKCPQCGKEAIIKGQEQYGGGWICWKKKDGCGAKFADGADAIEQQSTGVEDPSDLSNTILKMACKRALVAAVLNGTAASDCFTQDLEDLTEKAAEYTPSKASADPVPKASAATQQVGHGADPSGAPAAKDSTGDKKTGTGAANIVHDGTYITDAQLKKLHVTRREAGGQWWTFEGKDEDHANSLWRTKVLAIYRDTDGTRIMSSKQLSKKQASHLIERMTAYIAKTNARVDGPIDVAGADVTPIWLRLPIAEVVARIQAEGDRLQIDPDKILGIYSVDSLQELKEPQLREVLKLVEHWNTPQYDRVLAEVQQGTAPAAGAPLDDDIAF
jgi:hypothetical protein